MKTQALQDLVKKIFSDEATKAQFQSNPESIMSRFELSEEEKRAVLSTYSTVGLNTDGTAHIEVKPMTFWI
jgi:hypothetical protein